MPDTPDAFPRRLRQLSARIPLTKFISIDWCKDLIQAADRLEQQQARIEELEAACKAALAFELEAIAQLEAKWPELPVQPYYDITDKLRAAIAEGRK